MGILTRELVRNTFYDITMTAAGIMAKRTFYRPSKLTIALTSIVNDASDVRKSMDSEVENQEICRN